MKTTRHLLAALALLGSSLSALPAAADPQPACRDDARRHCTGVKPGGGRLVACLQEHEAQLSAACRSALPTLARCGDELRKLCGEAASRQGLRECLRAQGTNLSPECRGPAPAR